MCQFCQNEDRNYHIKSTLHGVSVFSTLPEIQCSKLNILTDLTIPDKLIVYLFTILMARKYKRQNNDAHY